MVTFACFSLAEVEVGVCLLVVGLMWSRPGGNTQLEGSILIIVGTISVGRCLEKAGIQGVPP